MAIAWQTARLARLVVVASIPSLLGCASVRTVQTPLTEAARRELQDEVPKAADVSWVAGASVARERALNLSLSANDAAWAREGTAEKRVVPVDALRSIDWVNHSSGAVTGLFLGALAGGTALALIGGLFGGDPPCPGTDFCFRLSAKDKAVVGGIVGLAAGAVIGVVTGAARGSPMSVQFAPPAQQ